MKGHDTMSDDQLDNEIAAQKALYTAIQTMRDAILFVNDASASVRLDLHHFDDFVADHMPDRVGWDETIRAKRAL